MLLFGLAWGGVHEAAEEFQQIATEENEHIGLSIIYTLCRTYGFKSQSSCKFFEDVQKTVESRIDPDRLKALRELS